MPKQILHRPDVHSAFKQVGGKRMSKRVAARPFGDPSFIHCFSKLPSHRVLMKMMPGDTASPRMWAKFRVLPTNVWVIFTDFIAAKGWRQLAIYSQFSDPSVLSAPT